MEYEKIFVVVPVYKVEAYLDRCISSILNQTYTNWELVLVDDGSPDNCPAICDRYAAEYENITVIHQENGGPSAARNAGIRYVQQFGDPQCSWITFIDSDDFVHPMYLDYLHQSALKANTAVSSCGFVRTEAAEIAYEEIKELKYARISPEEYLRKAITNASLAWGKLYRLYLFRDVRYPVGKIFEDDFTTHKLLFQLPEIAVIWTPLYYWYINHESISQSAWKPSRIDKLDALEEQLSFFEKYGFPGA